VTTNQIEEGNKKPHKKGTQYRRQLRFYACTVEKIYMRNKEISKRYTQRFVFTLFGAVCWPVSEEKYKMFFFFILKSLYFPLFNAEKKVLSLDFHFYFILCSVVFIYIFFSLCEQNIRVFYEHNVLPSDGHSGKACIYPFSTGWLLSMAAKQKAKC
jgi:hypothetical protein